MSVQPTFERPIDRFTVPAIDGALGWNDPGALGPLLALRGSFQ